MKGMNISLSYCVLSQAISKNRKSRGNHDHLFCAMICNLPKARIYFCYCLCINIVESGVCVEYS